MVPVDELEPRCLLSTAPNDPRVGEQWALKAIRAAKAWQVTTGSYAVTIAHVDTGVDYLHPDLYRNVWINQAEIPPTVRAAVLDVDEDGIITFADLNSPANKGAFGVNDLNRNGYIDAGDLLKPYRSDGNGGWVDRVNGPTWEGETLYVDDIIGWDFADNDNNPFDRDRHGTHTAGIIGAIGNNRKGVAGLMWQVSLMVIKIFGDTGKPTSDARTAAAIRYSASAGAQIANHSWSSGGRKGDIVYRAIDYANGKGQLLVAAAGNDGVNNDRSRLASYPASYDLPNIISVGAMTAAGRCESWSNWGPRTVDVFAPGVSILSTSLSAMSSSPGGVYRSYSGTSMAAAFVSGTAGLILAADPSLTAAELRRRILDGADQTTALLGLATSGGRLNSAKSVLNISGVRVAQTSAAAPAVQNPTAKALPAGRACMFREPEAPVFA